MCRYISFLVFLSCVSTPSYEGYAFAEEALRAARQMKAHTIYPSLYAKARNQFKLGLVEFQNKNYDKANMYFKKSQKWSERAELLSYIKKSRQGGLY